MGFQDGRYNTKQLLNRIDGRKDIKERILQTDVLIIDEISCLSAKLFGIIDDVCRVIRNSSNRFGGIQIILAGDFR